MDRKTILAMLIALCTQSQIAFARPSMSDAYEGSGGGFWIFLLPMAVYGVYKSYGIGAGALAAAIIGALVYNFPGLLMIIDGVMALGILIGVFTGAFKDREY